MSNFNKLAKRESTEDALIRKMRAKAKKDPVVIGAFKEYDVPLSDLDGVEISFADLDVPAKTKDRRIYLNRKLLDKLDETDVMSYLIHELEHYLQQSTGDTKGSQAKDYLDKDTEMAAFQKQVEFKRENKGNGEAKEYVEDLLDYHKIMGPKRKEKKKELLGK
jgi:hypothetical protein